MSARRRRLCLLLSIAFLAGMLANAQTTDGGTQVDPLFAKWDRKDSELPDFGKRITIRHLIHHTGGLQP